MTTTRLHQQINELLTNVALHMQGKAASLVKTGAVDYDDTPNHDYSIAKAIVCAAIDDAAMIYRPLSKEGKSLLRNLKHF